MTDTNAATVTQDANPQQQEVQYVEDGDEGLARELGADEGIAINANDASGDDDDGEGIAIDTNQDFRRPLLKDGEYSGVVTRCEYKKSENSGQPMLTGSWSWRRAARRVCLCRSISASRLRRWQGR